MSALEHDHHEHRNFLAWVAETSLWMFSTALIDATTVLPVLVLSLSGSPFLASLLLSIRYAGQGWPQLIAASRVSGRAYRKPFYFLAVAPGRLLLLWPAFALLLGAKPLLAVTAIIVAYLAFWVSEGFSIVPWVDMVGKTVPATRRGLLFAAMHIIGGLLGIAAGGLVREVLRSPVVPFPVGYGVLFLVSFLVIAISTAAVFFLREPPSPPDEERYSTRALIRDIPNLLRGDASYRRLVALQALFGFAILPAPLYILYAAGWLRNTGGGAAAVGFFLAVQTAGMIIGNATWGYLADRHGNRLLLRVLAFAHVLVPLCATAAGLYARTMPPPWVISLAFAPTFFGFGALSSGTWMAITNYQLEIAPEHDRPAYIAVTNALNIPAVVLPMIGGLLLRVVGYHPLFLVASAFLLYAFLLTGTLTEPRHAYVQLHSPHQDLEKFDEEDGRT